VSGVTLGLVLATLAGLSTLLGASVTLFAKTPGPRFMAFTLGLSGGVMIYVSFVELLGSSVATLGVVPANLTFFLGMGLMFLIDVLIPHEYLAEHVCDPPPGLCPQDLSSEEPGSDELGCRRSGRRGRRFDGRGPRGRGAGRRGGLDQQARLLKIGLFVALGIGIHNFPEGMVTLAGALHDPSVGLAIAVAVAIHNIPEGLAVALPILAATGSRRKAFMWAALSGLAEPLGAGLTAAILVPILSPAVLGYALAAVAGIMVFVALDELIPASREYHSGHWAILGIVAGMIVMAMSLGLLTSTIFS
jgi:ZIP family zinc transporter